MELIGGFILLVIGGALLYGFVLFVAASMGIPLETRKGREKRTAIAAQMQAAAIEVEAQRQAAVAQRVGEIQQDRTYP